ncbi:MAG TPA: cytochrome c biogenesis protein CcsA [Spirochaetota bacterium]|nr:cytochrome c biogenesis protein CcsA [Spirochaetota bacterium]
MNIYRLVFIFMPVVIYMALIWAPPAAILGDASRILYFHVPVAWVSIVAFLVAGINSIILLVSEKNRREREFMAHNSAVAGMVFIILALITGSIWAKLSWGSYWNWDPRETSIVILMLIYIAYLSLYSSLKDNPNRGSISAVYLIIAMITMPFLVFIIPRIYPSLHPDTIINQERKIHLEAAMRITLFASIVTFTLLYGYIYRLMNRISALEIKAEEKHYDI